MKSFKVTIFSAFLVGGALAGYAERLELTTYYPAPYGVYNDLDLRSNSAQSARIRYFDTSSNSLYSLVLEGNTLVLRNARSGVVDRWYMAFREDNGVQVRGGTDNSGSPGIFVRGSDGNVGIGTADPGTDKLRVQGNTQVQGNAFVSGTFRIQGGGPAANRVLTATDNLGNAVWQSASGGGSVAGVANHNDIINVPSGTTSDWNILVSPREMGVVETGSDSDNALLRIECRAPVNNTTSWRIVARFYWRWSASAGTWISGTANYLIVPRSG